MTRRILLLTAILALFAVPSARADLVVTVGNATVTAEGTGTIDVFLRSTSVSPQKLSFFEFELAIDPPYDPVSWVQFQPGQTVTYHTDDPNYVFYNQTTSGPDGRTFDEDGNFYDGSPPGVEPFIGWFAFDGADLNPDGYVELTPGHDYLLARLELVHSLIPPHDPVGDIFTASVLGDILPAIFLGTSFYDETFVDEIPFSWASGDITIQGPDPSVIPEPGSLLLFAVVALGAVPYLRRRRLAKA